MSGWSSLWGTAHPFLKICGLRTLPEAEAARAAGATALGMLIGLTHRAEDEATETQGRSIAEALGGVAADRSGPNRSGPNRSGRATVAVLVTHLPDPAAIAALARRIGTTTIQVHGDVAPDGLRALRTLLPGGRFIKAIHVTGPASLVRAGTFAPLADALLLDTRTPDRLGGTGRTHDWSVSRRIVAAVAPVPVILAGGLNPANVAAAIDHVRPAGVDVNSGVEDRSGAKDPARMAAFLTAARTALAAIGTR